jgi:hypothetical protein
VLRKKLRLPKLQAALLLFAASCSFFQPEWKATIPDTLFVFQNLEGRTLSDLESDATMQLITSFSNTSVSDIKKLLDAEQKPYYPTGIGVAPVKRDAMTAIWWINAETSLLTAIRERFMKRGAELSYDFMGYRISKFTLENSAFVHAAQIGKTLILSPSGFGVEEALRTGKGKNPVLAAPEVQKPGVFFFNTSQTGRLLAELSAVEFGRRFQDLFEAFPPVIIETAAARGPQLWSVQGLIPAPVTPPVSLGFLSQQDAPVTLDRLIPADAAAWAIMQDRPGSLSQVKDDTLSYFLSRNPETKQLLITALGNENGWGAFTAAGLNGTGEAAFFRNIADTNRFRKGVQQLLNAGMIYETGDGSYGVGSAALARLFGGPWCSLSNFFLRPLEGGLVLSVSDALVRSIAENQRRGSVLHYDDTYISRRPFWAENVSAVFSANATRYFEYLSTALNVKHPSDILFRQASDVILVITRQNGLVNLALSGYPSGSSANEPVRERWLFALGETEDLTAPPVFVDIKGSSRSEVLFATTSGNVVALASDGTPVFQASTLPEKPVGAPVVADWYGNKTKAVLIAAGTRIYGWSPDGRMLPKFPIDVNENIVSSLVVADVNRDKSPDAIIATESAKIRILNNRGLPLFGWPKETGLPVYHTPLFYTEENNRMIWCFAENRVLGWFSDGTAIGNMPVIINAALSGSPLAYQDRVFGSGLDGHLYVVGNPYFPAERDVFTAAGKPSNGTQALYIAASGLYGTPKTVTMAFSVTDSTRQNATLIQVQSLDGGFYLIAPDGTVAFAQNMGQPSNEQQPAVFADLDNDGIPELLAVAEFGRLFAWNIQSQQRILDLPTAAMQVIGTTDFEGDGKTELVAKTIEGIRCWTISLNR